MLYAGAVEGLPIFVLHLAQVVDGPVVDVEGIPQVIGVRGAQLEFDIRGGAGGQPVQAEQQRLLAVEIPAAARKGRKIDIVGHAVAVVIHIQQVGSVIAVAVPGGVGVGVVPFGVVFEAILVAILQVGVAVPALVVQQETLHLERIRDAVPVRVHAIRVPIAIPIDGDRTGAQQRFLFVGQSIPIVVAGGIHNLRPKT